MLSDADLRGTGLLLETMLIGGEWVAARDGATLDVTDPATGDVIGTIPAAGAADTEAAIAAAADALPAWKRRTADDRATLLERWHALILDHADTLAAIMTAEQGKPLAEAKGEIGYAASFVKWFATKGGESPATPSRPRPAIAASSRPANRSASARRSRRGISRRR